MKDKLDQCHRYRCQDNQVNRSGIANDSFSPSPMRDASAKEAKALGCIVERMEQGCRVLLTGFVAFRPGITLDVLEPVMRSSQKKASS